MFSDIAQYEELLIMMSYVNSDISMCLALLDEFIDVILIYDINTFPHYIVLFISHIL